MIPLILYLMSIVSPLLFVLLGLILFMLGRARIAAYLCLFGGLVGLLFVSVMFADGTLVVQSTLNPQTGLYVDYTQPIGYWLLVPALVTAACFIIGMVIPYPDAPRKG